MTAKPLQTNADYQASLKSVSALIDAGPLCGTSDASQLDGVGAVVEAYEVNGIALTMQRELRVTLSKQDFLAFSEAVGDIFNPNSTLKSALSAAKKSVRRC